VLVTPGQTLTDRIRLHQTAVHGTDHRQPYARLLARGVVHVPARVVSVEPAGRGLEIEGPDGRSWLAYDALILALGSGLSARIPSTSPLAMALQDHEHALQLSAALPRLSPGERVIIVGGGLSAIELAAEIAETYPQLRVELFTEQLAAGLNDAVRSVLAEELRGLGVTIREAVRVERLEPTGVRLVDGSFERAALAVVASGFEAAPLAAAGAFSRGDYGRVPVDEQLRVLTEGPTGTHPLPNVFAAGDFSQPPAASIGTGLRTTRMGCVDAMPLGLHAADQVARLLSGAALEPFHFNYAIQCISLGRRRGAVVFVDRDDHPTGRVIRGRVAALVKETICRFVIGSLRFERVTASFYGARRPATLSDASTLEAQAE
jgi:NADH dehydrogenase FAD-containing subunit